jgi:type I restriction enzyme S subunit
LDQIAPIVRRPVPTEIDRSYPIIAVRSFGRGTFHQPIAEGRDLTWQRLFQVRRGDLLVSNIKAWEGAVAVVGKADDGMYCSHRYITCVADSTKALPQWLAMYFKTPAAVQQLAAASPGSADRNRTLSLDGLRAVTVPLPPLNEQRRIVARIEELAAKIGEARELRQSALQASQRLLVAMAHRADLSTDAKLRDSWRRMKLADLLSEYSDPHPVRPDLTYPNFGIYSFGRGLFSKPPISGLESSAKQVYRARAGLFIYSRLFAFEGAYGMVDEAHDGYFVSNEYPMFVCDGTQMLPEFLTAYCRSRSIWKRLAEGSVGLGDRRQRVQPEQILRHELLLPPMSWQQKIRHVHQKISLMMDCQRQTASEMEAILPAILDKAFKGQL